MTRTTLVLGSRGSDLALYQANFISDKIRNELDAEVTIKIIKTTGDKIDTVSFDKMEGKGFFTKELEEALLSKEIDLAVHSLKDLMTTQPDGLKLGAVGYREDRRELLLIKPESYIEGGVIPVKPGGIVGTSSARRKCQIIEHNKNVTINELRGNVPTRIRKLREGNYDAIVIAAAGVKRLELDVSDLKAIHLDSEQFFPAPAQGILGIQIRDNDHRVEDVVSRLGSADAMVIAELERGLLAKFDSGCSLPLGVYSDKKNDQHRLKAVLGIFENESWQGLRRTEVCGTNVKAMVDQAYTALTSES